MTSSPKRPEQAPWEFFRPHATRPGAFFLDRGERDEPSFVGSDPTTRLVVENDGTVREWRAGRWTRSNRNPIDAIETYVEESRRVPLDAPEWLDRSSPLPRTVGYLAYELGASIERVPLADDDGESLPLAVLSTYDSVVARNPANGAVAEVVFDNRRDDRPVPQPSGARPRPDGLLPSDRGRYERGFARIMEAIRAGEIYQANLSRRLAAEITGSAPELYARLRERQPAPYGAYVDCGAFQILSNSPECYLRVVGDRISTHPIKGTRPRGVDDDDDARLVAELASDPKERAEHVMIVDLERNDLGRVCRTGSVRVDRSMRVATFATLHHLVSEVRGELRDDATLGAVLRATFPGGSITGAPKIRAMEIIAEVEADRRGVYTGAVGCWNGGRQLELNVAIRTAVHTDGVVRFATGGGIVADSECTSEWRETETKALAFTDSLNPVRARRGAVG